jgi:hypothetical protein
LKVEINLRSPRHHILKFVHQRLIEFIEDNGGGGDDYPPRTVVPSGVMTITALT